MLGAGGAFKVEECQIVNAIPVEELRFPPGMAFSVDMLAGLS